MVAKVRTGCVTCKRRHVKCDESKPACQRCIKWRGYCDGYEDLRSQSRTPDTGKSRSQTRSPDYAKGKEKEKEKEKEKQKEGDKIKMPRWYRSLVNESSKLSSRPQDVCASHGTPTGACVNSGNGPSSTQGNQKSNFDETFWQTIVPHLVRQNAAVWYANLAIHALIDSKRPTWVEDGGGHSSDSFRRALKYHGLALGQLSKEPITRSALQSATLCCLFFVIFEMMNGDDKAAHAHMYNGCKMMSEIQKNATGEAASNGNIDTMLHVEMQKALRFVASQVNGPSLNLSLSMPVDAMSDVTPRGGITDSVASLTSVASTTTIGSVASVTSSEGAGSAPSMDEIVFDPSHF